MLSYLLNGKVFFESPLIFFVILLFVSHAIYFIYFRSRRPSVASGSIIMALSAIALYCLPQISAPPLLVLGVALELFIVWIYLGVELLHCLLQDELPFNNFLVRLEIGSWVAGTIFVALLLDHAEQTLHGFIVLLGIVAMALWIVSLVIFARWFVFYFHKKLYPPVSGRIFFGTISMQALVLLLSQLFGNDVSAIVYQFLVCFGLLLYLLSLVVFLRYSFLIHGKKVIAYWQTINVLMYGALMLSGQALIESKSFSSSWSMSIWWCAFICFLFVELLELARLVGRIKLKGWIHGIAVYHVSQWARLFSLAALYAFSLSYIQHALPANPLVAGIANYGQYVIFILLLIEFLLISLWLSSSNFKLSH